MDDVKKRIKQVLKSISDGELENLCQKLEAAGVESFDDLFFIEYDDLKDVLKPVPLRKLLAAAKHSQPAQSNRHEATQSSLDWTAIFDVPIERLSSSMRYTLLHSQKSEVRDRCQFVIAIVESMLEQCARPSRDQCSSVAKRIVRKYPGTFLETDKYGHVEGSGFENLASEIKVCVNNLQSHLQSHNHVNSLQNSADISDCSDDATSNKKRRLSQSSGDAAGPSRSFIDSLSSQPLFAKSQPVFPGHDFPEQPPPQPVLTSIKQELRDDAENDSFNAPPMNEHHPSLSSLNTSHMLWPELLEIPLEHLTISIRTALRTGQRLSAVERRQFVCVIVDAMRLHDLNPGKRQCTAVARKCVDQFPNSFTERGPTGEYLDSGFEFLIKQMKNRIDNLNRHSPHIPRRRRKRRAIEDPALLATVSQSAAGDVQDEMSDSQDTRRMEKGWAMHDRDTSSVVSVESASAEYTTGADDSQVLDDKDGEAAERSGEQRTEEDEESGDNMEERKEAGSADRCLEQAKFTSINQGDGGLDEELSKHFTNRRVFTESKIRDILHPLSAAALMSSFKNYSDPH